MVQHKETIDWAAARRKLAGELTPEDERIVELLAQGATQREIGQQIGQHRSNVWRRIKSLRIRLTRSDS